MENIKQVLGKMVREKAGEWLEENATLQRDNYKHPDTGQTLSQEAYYSDRDINLSIEYAEDEIFGKISSLSEITENVLEDDEVCIQFMDILKEVYNGKIICTKGEK